MSMSGVCLDGRLHLHVLVKILTGLGQFDTGASGSGYERKKSLPRPTLPRFLHVRVRGASVVMT